jgi:hypothetical protein
MSDKGEWIRVEDRLPEKSYKSRLVYRNIPGHNPGFDVAEWDEAQQEWYAWSDVADVLYWMDIPQLPNEELT